MTFKSMAFEGWIFLLNGKKDSVTQNDFPESMANLSSHLALSDNLIFSQGLYYTRMNYTFCI